MGSYRAIDAATLTLAKFLQGRTGLPIESDKAPNDAVSDTQTRVHLYLFEVDLNPAFENAAWERTAPGKLAGPPIGFNLRLLIVPHGPGQGQIRQTLGEVMKVLHDEAVIPTSFYEPDLVGATEELRLTLRPLSLDQQIQFWQSFEQRSYRLSVAYELSAVLMASDEERSVLPVEEREVEVGVRR